MLFCNKLGSSHWSQPIYLRPWGERLFIPDDLAQASFFFFFFLCCLLLSVLVAVTSMQLKSVGYLRRQVLDSLTAQVLIAPHSSSLSLSLTLIFVVITIRLNLFLCRHIGCSSLFKTDAVREANSLCRLSAFRKSHRVVLSYWSVLVKAGETHPSRISTDASISIYSSPGFNPSGVHRIK